MFIGLMLASCTPLLQGQVIDTSKRINTWRLMHQFTRFEETPLDTNMHQLHREYQPAYKQGFSYEYLGILGHAMNHVDFSRRPEPDQFLFGRAWDPYLKKPERTVFFNTRVPFTSLAYSTIPFVDWREENVEVLHTQNTTPFTNFGIEFNILAGKELYRNEETRSNRVGLFGSHAKERYSIFGTFYYNDFNADENGGLADLESFRNGELEQYFDYEVNLSDATSHYRNLSLFTTQNYHLLERQVNRDTLGNETVTGKTLSVSHQLHIQRHLKDYRDDVNPDAIPPVYRNYYYSVNNPVDSASEGRITNVFQMILGDPDYDRISARVYAGHIYRRFGSLSPVSVSYLETDTLSADPLDIDSIFTDTVEARFAAASFNDIYIGFHLAGPTTGIWDWVVSGRYYLAGYDQNNFEANATFSRSLRDRAELGLRGSLSLKRPHYFTNQYSSSFFRWEHDYPSTVEGGGEAFLKSQSTDMDLRAGVTYLSNYIYWDQEAQPRLYDRDLLVFSGYFSRHFRAGGFHSENRLLLQYTTAGEVLRLPLAAVYTSNFWMQPFFNGALITDVGFDLYTTTRYRANTYMPATSIFHLQDEEEIGGFPFLDVFLAFKISRTRIFLSYSNLLHGIGFVGNNFFTTYRYPMKPRTFRFGLVWTFYD